VQHGANFLFWGAFLEALGGGSLGALGFLGDGPPFGGAFASAPASATVVDDGERNLAQLKLLGLLLKLLIGGRC
jgi:hypothetical protein